jgi:hypothetical protein
MRKPTMLFALALVLALLPAPIPTPNPIAMAQASTVVIHAQVTKTELVDDEGEDLGDAGPKTVVYENICSGYVAYTEMLEDGSYLSLVTTAKHCTQPETSSIDGVPILRVDLVPDYVSFKDGDVGIVKAIFPSTNGDDIAFMNVVTANPHPALWPALELPAQGEPLFVYGMPLGQEFALSPATMMQDHQLFHDDDPSNPPWENDAYLIACASCGPGNSGGPVLNMRGQVVGIVNAGGEHAQTLMFPLERLRLWLAIMGAPSP